MLKTFASPKPKNNILKSLRGMKYLLIIVLENLLGKCE